MKALLISGLGLDEACGPAARAAIEEALGARGFEVDVVDAVEAQVRPCVGCGSCGLRTPGRCVVKDDMQQIYPRIVACDLLILAGPVSFGAHSFTVKKIIDRLQPLMLPLYTKRDGEMKFQPRYPRPVAWMGVGLLASGDPQRGTQEAAFRLLIERHAVNVAAAAHAAAVFTGDDPARMESELTTAMDAVTRAAAGTATGAASSGPAFRRAAGVSGAAPPSVAPTPVMNGVAGPVLIIQGSPRKKANTRAIVAGLRAELERLGATADVFHVPAKGAAPDDLGDLQRKLQACEVVVLAAPVYFDGLPPVTQRLLELVAARRGDLDDLAPRLYGIAHSGFLEPIQREPELQAMELFAGTMGWPWQGGVGFGGTSPIDGRPLDEAGMFSKHVRRCLPRAAADIAAGRPFTAGTIALCDKPPFAIPLSLMIWTVNRGARKAARAVGVELEGSPYAGTETPPTD